MLARSSAEEHWSSKSNVGSSNLPGPATYKGTIMEERLKPNNKLRVYWSKREDDIIFYHPKWKVDSRLLLHYFCYAKHNFGSGETTLVEELERRGFDIETLKFSIAYKEDDE